MDAHNPIYEGIYQVSSFSLGHPVYGWMEECALIADNNQHIFKFGIKNVSNKSMSLHIEDLEQENYGQLVVKSDQSQLQEQLKMDVGVAVKKCSYHETMIENHHKIELIIVISMQSHLKIWYKIIQTSQNYQILQIDSSINQNCIIDYHIMGSTLNQPFNIQLLELIQSKQSNNKILRIQKFVIKFSQNRILLQKQSQKQDKNLLITQNQLQQNLNKINIREATLKFVDKSRIILMQNWLIGVYETFNIKLEAYLQKINHIVFGQHYILYSDMQSLRLYERKHDSSNIIVKSSKIQGLKFIQPDKTFVLITHSPLSASIYKINGQLLWAIPLSIIQSPIILENQNESANIKIFDINHHKIYVISKESIYKSMPYISNPTQELKLHQATITALKHRLQILKTLQSYISNNNFEAVFRFLNNCNNNSMMNDGLLFANKYVSLSNGCHLQAELQILILSFKLLQESKYESHIENSLQIMLASCKKVCSLTQTQQMKVWKEYTQMLGQIIDSKKVRKLKEQDKNKKIFELAYELVHTANSFLLRR